MAKPHFTAAQGLSDSPSSLIRSNNSGGCYGDGGQTADLLGAKYSTWLPAQERNAKARQNRQRRISLSHSPTSNWSLWHRTSPFQLACVQVPRLCKDNTLPDWYNPMRVGWIRRASSSMCLVVPGPLALRHRASITRNPRRDASSVVPVESKLVVSFHISWLITSSQLLLFEPPGVVDAWNPTNAESTGHFPLSHFHQSFFLTSLTLWNNLQVLMKVGHIQFLTKSSAMRSIQSAAVVTAIMWPVSTKMFSSWLRSLRHHMLVTMEMILRRLAKLRTTTAVVPTVVPIHRAQTQAANTFLSSDSSTTTPS